jgi:hypothetical protein
MAPHRPPALALAFAVFISPANAGQNFKPMELPKIGLTEDEARKKGDCLIRLLAEYAGNPQGLSAETVLRWHRREFRELQPKAREWAKALGNSTQPQSIDWLLKVFVGEDVKPIRFAYGKCFVENEEPGELGFD